MSNRSVSEERLKPVTATGHRPVPVLPRRAKNSFPGRGAAKRSGAAPSHWFQKGGGAGLRSASTVTLCWRGATPPSWLARPPQQRHCPPTHATGREGGPGNTGNGSPETSEKNRTTGTACGDPLPVLPLFPRAGLLPLLGPTARRALWESAPGCHEPGGLDTRDSGGEKEPTLWAAPILVLF